MPDSNGFGDYTESGQVIPVSFRGRKGGYTHCMFLNDEGPIAGGRELWGFPKKLAQPTLATSRSTRSSARWITVRCGSRPGRWDTSTVKRISAQVKASLEAPNFLLKIIPHVDGTPRICELVEYRLEDIVLKGAWTGPAAFVAWPRTLWRRSPNCRCCEIVSAVHIVADLTLGLGKVVHDYLQRPIRQSLPIGEESLAT